MAGKASTARSASATCAPGRLEERLEDVGDLGEDEIRQQQFVGRPEVASPPRSQVWWVAREMPDKDVGVDEHGHRRPAARARRV